MQDMNDETILFGELSGVYYDAKRKNEENSIYNVFSVMEVERAERQTHSKMIASLLDKDGEHRMGDQYLRMFIKNIGFGEWLSVGNDWSCVAEYHTNEARGNRPDFLI